MAETESGAGAKAHVSPIGALLVGLFLGAGVLFVYSTLATKRLEGELEKTRMHLRILEKRSMEAMAEIAKLKQAKPAETPKAAP